MTVVGDITVTLKIRERLSDMTDSELLDLIYDNDLEGMSSLIDRYAVAVYKTVADVLSGVGTQEDIEDCVADAFVAFYNNIDDVDLSRAGVKAYLCVIAFRRAVNLYFTISPDSEFTANFKQSVQVGVYLLFSKNIFYFYYLLINFLYSV